MRPRPSKKKAARGVAAVEFALVLPALLTVLLGTIDWGYYFFLREVVTNASREGARAGTLQSSDALASSQAATAAQNYLTSAGLSASNSTVTPTVSTGSVAVAVTYPAGSVTGFLTAFLPTQIQANAVMSR